jgi:hypothetical protein
MAGEAEMYAKVAPTYVVFGLPSLIFWWLMSLRHAWYPNKEHGLTLVYMMLACEAAYSFKFILSALFWLAGFKDGRASFHVVPDNCALSVAYGQFFGMAAISWNACWMTDVLVTLFLPLRNSAGLLPWYHAFVWAGAASTTLAVVLGAGHVESDMHTCWLRGDAGLSYAFVGPLLCFVALALVSLALAALRLRGGGSASQRLRTSVLLRHLAYVAAFAVLWLFPIIHSFYDRESSNLAFSLLDAIAVSSQACFTSMICLSEPGVRKSFKSTLCRLRNTLAASCGCGRLARYSPLATAAPADLLAGEAGALTSSVAAQCAHHPEAPLPLWAIFPPFFLCFDPIRDAARAEAAEGEQALLTPSLLDSSTGSALTASFSGSAGFWGFLFGKSSSRMGGLSGAVDASSALLAHAQTFSAAGPAGAAFRLGVPPPPITPSAAAATGAATGGPGSDRSARRSQASGEAVEGGFAGRAAASAAPLGGEATSRSTGSGSTGGDGAWGELSADLRQEMGVAMLTGLVQAVKLAAAASIRGREEGGGAGGSRNGTGSGSANRGSSPPPSPLPSPTRPFDDESSTSEGETLEAEAEMRRKRFSGEQRLLREPSHVVVAGPSAPVRRRRIGQLLRDSGTVTRSVPSLISLGGGLGLLTGQRDHYITVSSLEEAAFLELRRAGGIEASYLASTFDPALFAEGRLRAFFSEGASSSFFCRSSDDALVLKTIRGSEAEVLMRLVPAYTRHLRDNPSSLLCRFYGCFAVTLPTLARVFFVLMQNVHPITGTAPPGAHTFDLKGSIVNRTARVSKAQGGAGKKYLWQDVEFRETLPRGIPIVDGETLLRRAEEQQNQQQQQQGGGASSSSWGGWEDDLVAGTSRARLLVDQLQRDVTLLASQGIMDYSLLLQVVPITSLETSHASHAGHSHRPHPTAQQHHCIAFPPPLTSTPDHAPSTPLPPAAAAFTLADALRLMGKATVPNMHGTLVATAAAAAAVAGGGVGGGAAPAAGAGAGAGGGVEGGGLYGTSSGAGALPEWSSLAVSLCALGTPLGSRGDASSGGGGTSEGGAAEGGEPIRPRPHLPPSASRALVQVGVVDILQYFDTSKRVESAFKQLRYAGSAGGISAVDPNIYAVRFMSLVSSMFTPGDA